MRYTPTGKPVTHFRVAVNRRWRDAEGQPQEKVEWFRVVVWGRRAEVANQYLQKGSPIYVSGRLQTRSFEGNDGQTRYITELVARDFILLPRSNGFQSAAEEDLEEVEEGEEVGEIPL
jgi:single-strand DNA-binding protein